MYMFIVQKFLMKKNGLKPNDIQNIKMTEKSQNGCEHIIAVKNWDNRLNYLDYDELLGTSLNTVPNIVCKAFIMEIDYISFQQACDEISLSALKKVYIRCKKIVDF